MNILIIDHGKWCYKVGISSFSRPIRLKSPCVIRNEFLDLFSGQKKIMFEDEIIYSNNPVSDSVINDFDDMQVIWDYIFYEGLKFKPSHYTLVFIEPVYSSTSQREQISKIMFERYKFSSLLFLNTAKISFTYTLHADSGILVDCAFDTTRIIPFHNYNIVDDCILNNQIGGKHVTKSIFSSIFIRGGLNSHRIDFDGADYIKRSHSFFRSKFDYENTYPRNLNDLNKSYVYLDDYPIEVGDELFKAPDILFNPETIGSDQKGIHILIKEVICKAQKNHKINLKLNIILSGGSSLIKGFRNRFIDELVALNLDNFEIILPDNPDVLSWCGSKKLCENTELFDNLKIKRGDYLKENDRTPNG